MQQNTKTPGRRRRSAKLSSAQKNYASENDVHSDMPFAPDFPATPMKSNVGSPAPAASLPANSKSNRRNTNKGRPKNVSTSPGPAKPGRRTPPLSATSNIPSSAAAYAGATFHASPAPSSLPIPSFLGKAMTDSPSVKGTIKELSPPASDSESASPPQSAPVTRATREETPMDFLFRAYDKEQARRASSVSGTTALGGPFSPPSEPPASAPPARQMDYSPHGNQSRRLPLQQRHSDSGGPFGPELNGTPGRGPLGPAFSTPYQDRIRAAQRQMPQRSARNTQFSQEQQVATPPSGDDKSEALKRYLSIGQYSAQSPTSTRPVTVPAYSGASNTVMTVVQAGPNLPAQVASPPAERVARTESPVASFALENHLRQVLNLGCSPGVYSSSTMDRRQAS